MAAGSITYGGEPALLDWTGDLAKILESAWPKSRWPFRDRRIGSPLSHSMFPETPDGLFESPYPEIPLPELNELIVPTGASRFARSIILVHDDERCAITGKAWGECGASSGSGEPKMNALPLTFDYGGDSFTWKMFCLTPQLVDATGDKELWAIPLVDRRYFWQGFLRKLDLQPDPLWSELFTKIGELLGVAINHPPVGLAYQLPDFDTFTTEGVSLAHLLDAAALSVGCRAIFDGDGTVTLQSTTQAESQHTSNVANCEGAIQLGGETRRQPLPAELNLIVRKLSNYFRNCGQQVETADIDVETKSPEVVSIHSTFWSNWLDGNQQSTNASNLTDLAEQLASHLADWAVDPYSATFSGVAIWSPTGYDDYLSVGLRGAAGVTTQVRAMPTDFFPRIQLSQAPALFYHEDDGLVLRMSSGSDIDAASGYALTHGFATPMEPDEKTGILQDRTASDGSGVLVKAWNASPGEVVAWDGSETIIQAKRTNCKALIDVEYCPPDETSGGA